MWQFFEVTIINEHSYDVCSGFQLIIEKTRFHRLSAITQDQLNHGFNENDEKYIIMVSLLPWLLAAAWIVLISMNHLYHVIVFTLYYSCCHCAVTFMKIVGREEGRGCSIPVFREHDSCQRGSKNKEFLDFYAHNYALMQVYRAQQTLYKPSPPMLVEPCTPASHDEWEHEFEVFIISWDGEKSRWRKFVVLSEKILRGGVKKQRIHGFSCSHFIMSSRDLLFLRSTSSRCFKNHGGTKQVVTSNI